MKTWKIFLCCGLITMGLTPAYAAFTPLRDDVEGDRPQIQILRDDPDQVQIEVKLPGVELLEGELEGRRWDRVEIPGGGYEYELGAPEVPHFTRLLIIPTTTGVRAEFEALESQTLPNVDLMPAQGLDPEDLKQNPQPVRFNMSDYSQDAFYPQDEVMTGEPAVMRGLRVVALRMNPVRYNPVRKELRVATRYRVTVHFEGTNLRNVPKRQFPVSRAWGNLVRGASLNLDDNAVDEQDMGSYLIICVNNSTLIDNLQPLIEWKRRKGHSVTLQTFSAGASNSTIKNMIQTAYNAWPIPPEYVLLVGDVDGTYALPGWQYGETIDHPYSQLDGGDILADVALGRMPTNSVTNTQTMVNKVLFYEKMPYTTDPYWFKHSVLAAGYSGSSYSMYQTSRWIKTRMVWAGYSTIDTVFYSQYGSSSAMQTATINSINNGVTYYNYRGWVSQSLTTSQINGLTNGRKLPFATILTCGTGGFQSTQEMEVYLTAGTPNNPAGGIAAVGLATLSTHVNFNNTIDMGIYAGLFEEGITQTGTSVNRGKLELYNAYQQNNPGVVNDYSHWCALAGDPGVELFTGAIQYMTCPLPDQVSLGQNSVSLTVNMQSGPALEAATVCFYKTDELQSVGLTDANGQVTLPLNGATAGNVKVTITKHNYYPVVDSLDIVQADVAVGYYSHTIDDDNLGGSSGDGDGIVNPGEAVQIPLVFKNYGTSITATGISVTATESDDYAVLTNATLSFPDLAPGATGNSDGSFLLTISPDCPHGHLVRLNLVTTSNQGSWDGLLDVDVASYDMTMRSAVASGSDSLLSPGETANFVLWVSNDGGKNAASLTATLSSLNPYVTVNDNSASFGTVNVGAIASCITDPFNLTAADNTPPGQKADLQVTFTSSTGAVQTDTITISLGAKSQADPQGPDEYGYYCFDNTDVNYAQAPIYSWVETDSGYGGSGTRLPITDGSEGADQSVLVNLPFTFRFYGQTTNQLTVCSNGWISTTPDVSYTDFRNYQIPSPIGPSGHICVFWDDLITSPGHVFSWNDAANHRFIVEWSRMNILQTSSQQVVEIILYDPAYYPTPTGDGEIVFQYNVVNDVYGSNPNDNPYSTVGIESPDRQTGIEVVYWNTYDDPAAAHLQNNRAYRFTTGFTYMPAGSDLYVTLTPYGAPIVIPPGGGSFSYNIAGGNNSSTPASADVWCMVTLPNGSQYGPTLGPMVGINFPGNWSVNRDRTQAVPAGAPAGSYTYHGYVGIYPSIVYDEDSFTFTKSGDDGSGNWLEGWENSGEPFEEAGVIAAKAVPESYALYGSYPNPFNPQTTIAYDLPRDSRVRLEVFDLLGRQVAVLVNGTMTAGTHHAVWGASSAPSGLYLLRLEAGDFHAVQKLVLMK